MSVDMRCMEYLLYLATILIRALSAPSATEFNISFGCGHYSYIATERRGKMDIHDWDTACENFKTYLYLLFASLLLSSAIYWLEFTTF
jgi:hypothetical protein